jgi:hypothetical protein
MSEDTPISRSFLHLSAAFALAALFLFAVDSSGADVHGFVQANYSLRATGDRPPARQGGDYLVAEQRLELEATDEASRGASFFVKADFFHDGISEKSDMELREAYIGYTAGALDLRIGRQIITWGTGDMLFINDTSPKDYGAFYSGRPLEYLKGPADSLKLDITGALSTEIVITPSFEPNRLPDGTLFYISDPFSSVNAKTVVEPPMRTGNAEVSLRLYRYFGSTDVSLYAHKGFSRMPAARPDSMTAPSAVTYFYPELSVYGLSITSSVLGGVGNIEAGYYDSREDKDGSDPAIENSKVKFLAGYKRELGAELTAGVQYYIEAMENYGAYEKALAPGMTKEKKQRNYATLRLTKMLMYQTMRLSLFTIYSPSDKDHLVNPEASYKLTDELGFTLGGNIFGGESSATPFGSLGKNDNIYANLRYQF